MHPMRHVKRWLALWRLRKHKQNRSGWDRGEHQLLSEIVRDYRIRKGKILP